MLDQPIGSTRPDRNHALFEGAPTELRTTSPFVGRGAELSELDDGISAVEHGEGRLFLIAGEPGIGKTRLATEFACAARARGALVHWGRCWEAGGAPSFWPWVEVIRHIFKESEIRNLSELGRNVGYLAQLVPELGDQLDAVSDSRPSPADAESARFFLFDAVANLLRRAAAHRPVVIVIDDLHAADRVSLLLLAFLARTLSDCGILFVGTYRDLEISLPDDLIEPVADLRRHARRLSLRGLAASDVGRLIESAAGRHPSDALVTKIHCITGGNPFFVDELLRLLMSAGAVGEGELFALGIPAGVRDMVRRRLEPLSAENTALLELAAVAGREFESAVIGAASGLELMEVVEALDDPVRHGIVVEVVGGAGRFSFQHALIREVLYEQLAPARRLRLHQRLAEAFEKLSACDHERYVAELAHHSLVAAPSGEGTRFVEHGARAARRAMARMGFEEAVALYQRTIDALVYAPPDELRRCELLLALGEAKELANDASGSRSTFEQAAMLARGIGAPGLFAKAALGVGAIEALKFTASSRCEAAPELLREALHLVSERDAGTRARLLSRLGPYLLSIGSGSEALQLSAEAITAARLSGEPETLARALIARYAVLFGPNHIEERVAIAEEVLRIGLVLGRREFALRGHALRVTNLLELGDVRTADEAIEAHSRLAEETADPFERWASLLWRGARALLDGRFAEAEERSRQAFDLSQSVPGTHAAELNGPVAFAGQTILIQEARDDEMPDCDAVADYYRARFPEIVTWRVVTLQRLTKLGRVVEARRELDLLLPKNFVEWERNGTWLAAMSYLSEAIAFVGDVQRASMLYPMLLPYAERNATISLICCRGSVARPLGLLAATMGCWADAARHFEAAIAMNTRMGARPLVALTMHDYARFLATRGDATRLRARELAGEALRLATELGIRGLMRKCAALIDELRIGSGTERTHVSVDDAAIRLEKDGQFWILRGASERVLLRDAKGLAYLAELLRYPEREIHAVELLAVAAQSETGRPPIRAQEATVMAMRSRDVSEELVDARARRAYQRRLADLTEELQSAEADGDPERTLALRQEIGALRRELARATGLGGRARRTSNSERARINVTRAIRLSLTRIVEASPALGGQVARGIRTGLFCSYVPVRAAP